MLLIRKKSFKGWLLQPWTSQHIKQESSYSVRRY